MGNLYGDTHTNGKLSPPITASLNLDATVPLGIRHKAKLWPLTRKGFAWPIYHSKCFSPELKKPSDRVLIQKVCNLWVNSPHRIRSVLWSRQTSHGSSCKLSPRAHHVPAMSCVVFTEVLGAEYYNSLHFIIKKMRALKRYSTCSKWLSDKTVGPIALWTTRCLSVNTLHLLLFSENVLSRIQSWEWSLWKWHIHFKRIVIYEWIYLISSSEARVWNVIEPSNSTVDIVVVEYIIIGAYDTWQRTTLVHKLRRTEHFPTETRYEEAEAVQWAPWPRGPRSSSQTVYLKVWLIYHVLQCQPGGLAKNACLGLKPENLYVNNMPR